jgi:hypothetical protein
MGGTQTMAKKPIESEKELREAVVLLTASANAMCNAKDTEEIVKHFIEAKDTLVNIYKYNVERNLH